MEKAAQNIDEEADDVAQESPDKLDQLIESEAIAAQVLNDLKETIIGFGGYIRTGGSYFYEHCASRRN